MHDHRELYIGGEWVAAASTEVSDTFNPATEERIGSVPAATSADVDRAVAAAQRALPAWRAAPPAERAGHLRAFSAALADRAEEMAQIVQADGGAPITLSRRWQVAVPIEVLAGYADLIESLPEQERIGNSAVVREAAGVAVAIAPWNFPLLLGVNKVAAAIAAGCPVILKPSGVTPLHAFLLAQCAHDAGLPPGVFNLITGAGSVVGEALVRHPGVDVVSLTGSTTSGQRVGALAAEGVKRVVLELGGKSASLVLDDADLETAVRTSVDQAFVHGGQVCFAWTRLVVPRDRHDEAAEIAAAAIAGKRVGDPTDEAVDIGPVVSAAQRTSVRGYIDRGIEEGARLVCGGSEAPEGLEQRGYYVQPTVFADVDNAMTIAQEEIFGPVLSIIAHDGDDDAVRIANDSPYGLHGAVFSEDEDHAVTVARQIRTGCVDINGGPLNHFAPFGGVKHSGVGRDHGRYGLAEYQEVKSMQFPVGA